MATNQNSILGYIYIFSWCLTAAFSTILISQANQSTDPTVLCFFSFLFSSIFFILINIRTRGNVLQNKGIAKDLLWLNISTFFSWVMLVYPLKYIQPTVVTTIVLGTNPIATLAINRLIFRKKSTNKMTFLITIAIFMIICYVEYLCAQGLSIIGSFNQRDILISLFCCMIAGAATAINNIFIKKLLEKNISPTQILSFRFVFTVLLTGILIYIGNIGIQYDKSFFVNVATTSIFFVICPLMLIQLALRELDPIRVAIISPLMPLVVIAFQLMDGKTNPSILMILGAIGIWMLVTLGVYTSNRKEI